VSEGKKLCVRGVCPFLLEYQCILFCVSEIQKRGRGQRKGTSNIPGIVFHDDGFVDLLFSLRETPSLLQAG
jgi:hypothetical protein